MAVALWVVIMAFRAVNDTSVVAALFTVANYTYGPLLGIVCGRHVHRRGTPKPAPYLGSASPHPFSAMDWSNS